MSDVVNPLAPLRNNFSTRPISNVPSPKAQSLRPETPYNTPS